MNASPGFLQAVFRTAQKTPLSAAATCSDGLEAPHLCLPLPYPPGPALDQLPLGTEALVAIHVSSSSATFLNIHRVSSQSPKFRNQRPALPPFLCFFFAFSRATPLAYGGSQARGLIGAVAAGLCHSHSNMGSEPRLRPTPQLTATPHP